MIRTKEKGQVFILAIIALLILVTAIFILFDIQNVIRGKIKAKNAVDAAALVGAEWQRKTLNLIGELNLVKASTVLISDELFQIKKSDDANTQSTDAFLNKVNEEQQVGYSGEKAYTKKLQEAFRVLSQMQTRALFVGPMIGFGAAQQAALNNGMEANSSYGTAIREQLYDQYDSGLYDAFSGDEYVENVLFGFSWKEPYKKILASVLYPGGGMETGIAVMPNMTTIGEPKIISNRGTASELLDNKRIFEAVYAEDWCYLKSILRSNFTDWLTGIKVEVRRNAFARESEILPVKVQLSAGNDFVENAYKSDLLSDSAFSDSELRQYRVLPEYFTKYTLPALDWAVYKSAWNAYDSEKTRRWGDYLRSSLRPEAQYNSGAVARMDVKFPNTTITGTMGIDNGKGNQRTLGQSLGTVRNGTASTALSHASSFQRSMRNRYTSTYDLSLAKPFGAFSEGRIPNTVELTLPVFTRSLLIPISLENPGDNPLADYQWYLFKTKYIPKLGEVGSPDRMPDNLKAEFSYYHNALMKLNDPEWRNTGIAWLDTVVNFSQDENGAVITITNADNCPVYVTPTSGGSTLWHPNYLH